MKGKTHLVKVTVKTRAGRAGRAIFCPTCKTGAVVYHFDWDSLHCTSCDRMFKKTSWLTEA